MDHRYLLAVSLPQEKKALLEAAYLRATGQPIAIQNTHISLEFPFFLAERVGERDFLNRATQIPFFTFTATLSKTGMYRQKGKAILFLRAQPEAKFLELHGDLRRELQEYYRLDTSVYDGGVVPMYEPHLTLNYDFTGTEDQRKKIAEELKDFSFEVSNVELLKEVDKGVWVTMGSNH